MFEATLLNSSSNTGRSHKSWIVAVSVGLQAAMVMAFVVVPLIYPATLPPNALRLKLASISLLKKPEIKVQPKPQVLHVENTSATSVPTHAVYVEQARGGRMAVPTTSAIDDGQPAVMVGNGIVGSTSLVGLGLSTVGSNTNVVARAASPPRDAKPLTISSGVMAGRLLQPIQPGYPRIAMAARVQGSVVVTATIDRQGRIIGLLVLSGPELLRTAAVDAVKEARYKPFLLNGEPTEVTTTITVNFRMNS